MILNIYFRKLLFRGIIEMVYIFMTVDRNNYLTTLENSSKIIVIDVDGKKLIDHFDNPIILGVEGFEEFFEKYDPYILITLNADEENILGIEEYGVHVYFYKSMYFNDILDELYGFRV